ncbi:hypothetical protein VE02_01740 [Pseudogymnoascus sp. 03VT05]|nr:hypothetical protein VE02_01740 [Pseudogymnoascus sp. 03VT05]
MARTRPSTNGPAPIKKSSKSSEQPLYIVTRGTNDAEGVHDNHEIVGTYKTLAGANAAARNNLIKGWGHDYFDEYEASEVDGMVHVIAICPDGEEMVVMVEKSGGRKATPPPKDVEEQSYVVLRRSNTDEVQHILGLSEIVGTYKTLVDANAAARDYFRKGPGREHFVLYEVKEDVGVFVHNNEASPSKVAAPLNPNALFTYTVIRETLYLYGGRDKYEILNAYDTLAAANEFARNNMIEEWGRDYFEKFEVHEFGGIVRVNASCPDGKSMFVRVDKAVAKRSSVAGKPAAEDLTVDIPEELPVYHVSRHTIDYHNDPEGGMQYTAIKGAFLSLMKANECARRDLLDEWDEDFFEEYEETVHDGMVTIKTSCLEGEEMTVSVEKGTLFTNVEELEEVEEELEDSESESDDESL